MPKPKPKYFEILKNGLAKFKSTIKQRIHELNNKLSRLKESISSSDERRRDKAKTIDRILEGILKKLREWGGESKVTAPKKKRKRSKYEGRPKKPKRKEKPVVTASSPVFTKKEIATLEQRIEILDWYHANAKNRSATTRQFNPIYPNLRLQQSRISAWFRWENEYRVQWETARTNSDQKAKRVQQTEHPEISEMMHLWELKAKSDGIRITGEILRQKWTAFADLLGIPEDERLNLSSGWLGKFKQRNGLKQLKRHGEADSGWAELAEKERHRIQELTNKHGYRLRDIFNTDETILFYVMTPDRGLSDRKGAGVKGKTDRLIYAFTVNADGTEKLPPFIIGKAPQANQKSGSQLGCYYRNNATGYMTANLYQEWLQQWDKKLELEGRHILLLQDNFAGHIVPNGLKNIRVENFQPNLTSHIQPLDQGIIECFKAHYSSKFIQRVVSRYDEGVTPADIYQIDQLQAMRMAEMAWNEVDMTTIRNCWKKAGILPKKSSLSSINPPVTSRKNIFLSRFPYRPTRKLHRLWSLGRLAKWPVRL